MVYNTKVLPLEKQNWRNRIGLYQGGLAAVAIVAYFTLLTTSLWAEKVSAPNQTGSVIFNVPPDQPSAVTFDLEGWYCIEGSLDKAAKEFRLILQKTPYGSRPSLLGLDLEGALQQLTSLKIRKSPTEVVPAPGQKIVKSCFDVESWRLIMASFEKLVGATPYLVPVVAAEGKNSAAVISIDQSGKRWFIPDAPGSRPETIAQLPDGRVVTGGKTLGKLKKTTTITAPASPDIITGKPVYDKNNARVGKLQTAPDGSTYFAPFTPVGAMPAVPQKVEVLPGGAIVWAGVLIGHLEKPKRELNAPAPADRIIGKPVYSKNEALAGYVQTAPDGTQYFVPFTPAGAMPAQPQRVEVLPDGSVVWSGIKIGNLKAPDQGKGKGEETSASPPKSASIPKTPAAQFVLIPRGPEQAARARITALKQARTAANAKLKTLKRQKDKINTQILTLLRARDFSAKQKTTREVKRLEAQWSQLKRQQTLEFNNADDLRRALAQARKALPAAREKAKIQRRAQQRGKFIAGLYRETRPRGAIALLTGLLEPLDNTFGADKVDGLIESYARAKRTPSPLDFLDFLKTWLERQGNSGRTMAKDLERDHLRIIALIVQDPSRQQLWGIAPAKLPALRAQALAEADKSIRFLDRPREGSGATKSMARALDALEARLIRLTLSQGPARSVFERDFEQQLSRLQELARAAAPKSAKDADRFWSDYGNRLRQLILVGRRTEAPFSRRISSLISRNLAQNYALRAKARAQPDAVGAKLQLLAAQSFLVGGNKQQVLVNARLAEQSGTADIRLKARLLQLSLLRTMLEQEDTLTAADKRTIALLGQGTSPHDRLQNAIATLLKTIATSDDVPENIALKATLALWQTPRTRPRATVILKKMLRTARERGNALPPLLAAWEVLAKWPRQGVPAAKRADTLERLVDKPEILVALSRLVFAADLPKKTRLNLAHAIENLFWRKLRGEKDEKKRNVLIRAAIGFYKEYGGYYYSNDPDFLTANANGTSASEAERIQSNLQYWVNRLPANEQVRYQGVLGFGRAIVTNLDARKIARQRLAYTGRGRNRDLNKAIRLAFEEFKKGNIANAATAFDRVLELSRNKANPAETRALLASILRLVDMQTHSKLPLGLAQSVTSGKISPASLKVLGLMTRAERRRLATLKKPERAALAKLSARLRNAYEKMLSKAMQEETRTIALTLTNAFAGLSENATGEDGKKLDRLRTQQRAALERYRHLYRKHVKNSLGKQATNEQKNALESDIAALNRKIAAQEQRILGLKSGGENVAEGGKPVRKILSVELAKLNLLRAERDGVQDILIERFPQAGNTWGTRRKNLVRAIFSDINGTKEPPSEWRRKGGILQQIFYYAPDGMVRLSTDAAERKNARWISLFLKDKLRYLRGRRRAVMLEDKARDPSVSAEAYLAELERERSYWNKEGKWLSDGIYDFGANHRALALKLEQQARFAEVPTLIDQLIMAGKRGDPQKFFAFLAKIQNANLDAGLENYTKYLETPWYRLGLSQAYYLATDYTPWGSNWNYNEVFKRFTAQMENVSGFNAALLSASRQSVTKLKKRKPEAYDLLNRLGFIVEAKYALPRQFTYQPGTKLDTASQLTMLDQTVNAQSALEALATIIIPGKLAAYGAEYVASRWIALNALGRLGLEGALFTGYSRTGALMLDPSLGLEAKYWTFNTLLKDYAHTLLVMGALQRSSALAGRIGTELRGGAELRYGAQDILNMPLSQLGEVTGREWRWLLSGGPGRLGIEASVFQAIDSATSGSPVTTDGFIRNLVFLAELKALGFPLGKTLSDLRQRLKTTSRPALENKYRLTPEKIAGNPEIEPALRILMRDYGGDWQRLVDGFKTGKVLSKTMRSLVRLRQAIVDGMANQVVLEIYGIDRIATEKMWDAVGSVNLTSDYDLSFKGEKAELAVLLFNERFRARWGRALGIGGVESAGRLDTNVYTYPRFAEYAGNETDILSQEAAAQLGVRRYATDAEWLAHRQRIVGALKGAERIRMENLFDEVARNYAEATRALDRLAAGGDENAKIFAANKLYAEMLKRIIYLESAHKAATGAEKTRIAQQIRDTQSKALFFASEAYLTEAAINHVVFNTQAVGRKITAESLLKNQPEKLAIPMTGNNARQSLFEQLGYLLHQFGHYKGYHDNRAKAVKLSGKLAKYFLRLLDAAHLAGVDLKPIEALVRQTVEIEANRGNAEKLAELLPGIKAAEFADAVRNAMNRLSSEVYKAAPISIVQPVKSMPAPVSKTAKTANPPVTKTSGTAKSAPARVSSRKPKTAAPVASGKIKVFKPGPGGVSKGSGVSTGKPDPAQAGAAPAGKTDERQKLYGEDGSQIGWVYRDPGGQVWFQPFSIPGTLAAAPLKVELLPNGTVLSSYRKLGRVGTPARPSRKIEKPIQTPAVKPLIAQVKQRASQPQGRPVRNSAGDIIGYVENGPNGPNGRTWFSPGNYPDILTSPPQRVEVVGNGAIVLGGRVIGQTGTVGENNNTMKSFFASGKSITLTVTVNSGTTTSDRPLAPANDNTAVPDVAQSGKNKTTASVTTNSDAKTSDDLLRPKVAYFAKMNVDGFISDVYLDGDKTRYVTSSTLASVFRRDRNIMWQMFLDLGIYVEIPLPVRIPPTIKLREALGQEVVNGYDTTKYHIVQAGVDGYQADGLYWITAEGITVKTQASEIINGKSKNTTIELSNIVIGPLDPSLFEVPGNLKLSSFPLARGAN